MNREEYLKKKISEKGTNLKAIASEIGVPYSTLRDMQVNVGSARIDNVIKLCQYLDITVDELNSVNTEKIIVSEFEKKLILAYRENFEMRKAVNKLLDLNDLTMENPDKSTVQTISEATPIQTQIFRAARSKDNHPPEIVTTTKDFSKIKPSDDEI